MCFLNVCLEPTRPSWGVGGPDLGLEIIGSWCLMWKALQKEPKMKKKKKQKRKIQKKMID